MKNKLQTSVSDPGRARKGWVDVLRAIAIFFVISGHLLPGKTAYFVFTSPIKIPLFFMITGYVFNYGRKNVGEFFKNLFFKLIIPWLCLTVPFVLIKVPFKGFSVIPGGLLEIISGEKAWYMPCCVVAEILWFFTNKLAKKTVPVSVVAVVFCCLGLVAGHYHILDFAMINRALIAQFFILLGYLIKQYEPIISRMKLGVVLALLGGYICMGCVSLMIWPDASIDVHMNRYYNYPFCFAMIILGGIALFALAIWLNDKKGVVYPRVVLFLGQTTLAYYLLHTYSKLAFNYALAWLHIKLPEPVLFVALLIFIYVTCGIAAMILLRFFPWALGRKKKPGSGNKTKNRKTETT